jgi:hypothetical protein
MLDRYWYTFLNCRLLCLPNQDIGLMGEVTGQQGMFITPTLLPPLVYLEDRVCPSH